MRLAMIYALLGLKAEVGADHLLAALALWDYAERSVPYTFGDALGGPPAADLARLTRRAGARGVTKNEIANYLGRNVPADKTGRALGPPRRHRIAEPRTEETGGRPAGPGARQGRLPPDRAAGRGEDRQRPVGGRRAECPDAFPVLFVHGEVVIEAPAAAADRAAARLRRSTRFPSGSK